MALCPFCCLLRLTMGQLVTEISPWETPQNCRWRLGSYSDTTHSSPSSAFTALLLVEKCCFNVPCSMLRICQDQTTQHHFSDDRTHSLICAIIIPAHFWSCLPCFGAPSTHPAVNLCQWFSINSLSYQLLSLFVPEGVGIRLQGLKGIYRRLVYKSLPLFWPPSNSSHQKTVVFLSLLLRGSVDGEARVLRDLDSPFSSRHHLYSPPLPSSLMWCWGELLSIALSSNLIILPSTLLFSDSQSGRKQGWRNLPGISVAIKSGSPGNYLQKSFTRQEICAFVRLMSNQSQPALSTGQEHSLW